MAHHIYTPSRGRSPISGARLQVEHLEDRAVPAVVSFQEGVTYTGGSAIYSGTRDTAIFSAQPNANFAGDTNISIDQQDGGGAWQGLLRFEDIFGPGTGQIPLGSKITNAFLTFEVNSTTNTSAFVSLSRMSVGWDEATATWNSFPLTSNGIQIDDVEALSIVDGRLAQSDVGVSGTAAFVNIPVTAALQAWAAGLPNLGWVIYQFSSNGWDFSTSEDPDIADRPKLTVEFTPPSGAGEFTFLRNTLSVSEGNNGTKTVTVDVLRVGGDTGEVTVDVGLDTPPGTATQGTDYTFTPTTLTFPAGVRTRTVTLTITGDTTIEGPETVRLALSNATGGATILGGSTVITIEDNDILINEVFTNPPDVDTTFEFVEFIGTPGASLANINGVNGNNVYFVGLEGDAGAGVGSIDLAIDLSTTTIGSGGLLVARPTNFAYWTTAPAGVNEIVGGPLDLDPALENPSVTYALIVSTTPLTVGLDLDTNDDGVFDNLPAGALVIDSIGFTDNGANDRVIGFDGPGIRVAQPSGDQDAISRFNTISNNDLTPNFAAAWYGGDVVSTSNLVYIPPTESPLGRSMVNLPAGALVTPGAVNVPRAFGFQVSEIAVNETAGTLTVTVNRLGDDSVAASVSYATQDGTATAGQDYTAVSGTLNFAIGVTAQTFDVPILNDSIPEGFENFFLQLSNPSAPFQLAIGRARVTITDDDSLVKTFQDGVDNYEGTQDTQLTGWAPNLPFGSDLSISVDQNDNDPVISDDPNRPLQGLIRFDNLFGSAVNQIPAGARIFGGTITLFVTSQSAADAQLGFYRMLQDWNEAAATWAVPGSGMVNGVVPDDVEARAVADFVVPDPTRTGYVDIPVPAEVIQAWANGETNRGWLIKNDTGDGWDFLTSDSFIASQRPKLTVVYVDPAGAGSLRIRDSRYVVNENGTNLTVTVDRVGGSDGTVGVTLSTGGGTATDGSDYTGVSQTLSFGPGVLSQTVTIPILEDSVTETNETIGLTLTAPTGGATLGAGGATATITIRDNDAPTGVLLNEVLINPPGTDQPFEFLEVIGPASVGLGNFYLISMDGDNGVNQGNTDVVVDLSAVVNGTSGLTVAKATTGGHMVPAGTTVVTSPLFAATNQSERTLQNGTNSFLLIYSPTATLTTDQYDYDWDNDGTLELPAGSVIVDAFGVNDGDLGDRTYGGVELNLTGATADAVSRLRGNTSPLSGSAWFFGDLINAPSPNDTLVYGTPNANLPVPGAAVTPGEANTGTSIESPLTTLVSITPDSATQPTKVTLVFDRPITRVLTGAFAILDGSGNPLANISVGPATGVGTNTLVVPFTGSGLIGGALPGGATYRFRTIGSALIGTDRAADTNRDGNSDAGGSDGTFNIDVPIQLVGVLVNGTTAPSPSVTASRVTSLTVTFNTVVTTLNDGAFTLVNTLTGQTLLSGTGGAILVSGLNSSTLTLTFGSAPGVDFGSLSDGIWTLTTDLTKVKNGNNVAGTGTVTTNHIRRLFGDVNGDGTVDGTDFADFGNAFGQSLGDAGFLAALDFDANNTIDGTDFGEFGNRFGTSL